MKAPLKDGTYWEITSEQLTVWIRRHVNMDVEQEIRRAIGWLEDNPSRRKTSRGMTRFFGNWLRKADPDSVHIEDLELLQQTSPEWIERTTKELMEKRGMSRERAYEFALEYHGCPDKQGMGMVSND